jgi:uncharacterized protein (DUF2249 family)
MNPLRIFTSGARKVFADFQPEPVYLHLSTGLYGTLRWVDGETLNGEGAWRIDFIDGGQELGRWVDDASELEAVA